jgi:hypothetical protein
VRAWVAAVPSQTLSVHHLPLVFQALEALRPRPLPSEEGAAEMVDRTLT